MNNESLSKSDPNAYRTAHRHVEQQRGPADAYTCEFEDETCSGPITWSSISRHYEDPWDYTPMCLSHNICYDPGRRRLESELQDPCEGCTLIWEAEAAVIGGATLEVVKRYVENQRNV